MEDHTEIKIPQPFECLSCGEKFKTPDSLGPCGVTEFFCTDPEGSCPKCGGDVHDTSEHRQLAIFEQMNKPRGLTWFDLG